MTPALVIIIITFLLCKTCTLFFSFELVDRSADGFTLKFGSSRVVVHSKPFHAEVYNGDDLVISLNPRGLLKFEHYRPKPQG